MGTETALRCADCGQQYSYLGRTPHPGECLGCGSRAVPPAGDLTLVDGDLVREWNGVTLRFTDATDREFSYAVASVEHARVAVLSVRIDGLFVAADPSPASPLVTPALEDTLEQFFGVTPEFTVPASA